MRVAAILASLVLLTGCAQYEAQQRAQAAAQAQAQATSDDALCRSYGAPYGSPVYVQCRMNLNNERAADLQQRRAIAAQYLLLHR